MLYEIRNIKQNEGEPRRRWFIDDYFDLVVWIDETDEVEGFQLCYDKSVNQHALTWHRESGYMHNRVDDGEDKPGKPKGIPILVTDGNFNHKKTAEIFKKESTDLDEKISASIYKQILEYPNSNSKKEAEITAIRLVVTDYIEGWYVSNAGRVERSIHPELAKRERSADSQTGKSRLEHKGAMSLVKETRGVARTPEGKRQKDVVIFDVFENTASAKLTASDWVDYIHLGKFDGIWMIVNVLRKLKNGTIKLKLES